MSGVVPNFLQPSNFVLSPVYSWPLSRGVRQQSEEHDDSHTLRTVVSIHTAGTGYLVSVEYPASPAGSRSTALGSNDFPLTVSSATDGQTLTSPATVVAPAPASPPCATPKRFGHRATD